MMYEAVINIVVEAGSRLKMLMRCRPFYSIGALINLYESHILSFIESGTPAYYHAAPSILKLIDGVQDEFLEAIGISRKDAILHFNLAPLCTRRDIAMLGILHKVVLGVAPGPFYKLISRCVSSLRSYGFHNGVPFHNKQLQDDVGSCSPVMLKRSLFGLVFIYNRLPQEIVDAKSVQIFQRKLQCIFKEVLDVNPKWDLKFHLV